jgi:probable HAF family extracellular repeat protein
MSSSIPGDAMRPLFLHALRVLLLATPLLCFADPRYNVVQIAGAGSWASGINSSGQVVGSMAVGGNDHAFLFSAGTLSDIGGVFGTVSHAGGVNDLGQVAGWSESTAGFSGGWIYSGGTATPVAGAGILTASAINNSGSVTGTAWVAGAGDGGEYHAYVSNGSTFTDLGTIPGRYESHGYDINNAGHVAGSTSQDPGGGPNYPTNPMLYRGGVMADLGGDGFMGPWSYASALNAYDQVVGTLGVDFMDPGELYPTQAFLWQGGAYTLLGTLAPGLNSWASDINNLGWIVGGGKLDLSGITHGFVYIDGALVDLNTLIDPASGWVIEDASAINDLGQIAGKACIGGECYAVRLDLVSAVPEPAQSAMLLGGAVLFVLLRVVRRPVPRRRG